MAKIEFIPFLLFFHVSLAAVSFVFLFLIKKRNKTSSSSSLPPGPMKLPLIGNLHQLRGLPHESLLKLSDKHGPIMFLKLGSIPTLVVSSADIVGEIFRNHDLAFSGRPQLYAATKLSYNCSDVTFVPYGKYWRELRKILMLELLSAKRVQSFQRVRDEEVASVMESIASSSSSGPVDLSALMLSMANNVVCRVAFNKKYNVSGGDMKGSSSSSLEQVLRETQSLLAGFCLADFFPWLSWVNKFNGMEARVEKNFRELDAFYNKVIEEHLYQEKAKPDDESDDDQHEDLVDVLLRLQQDPNQETHLTNDRIKAVLTDMFIAGTDTSSATIVWTMAELIRHPSAMRKAQEEIRKVVKGKQKVQETDLSSLSYLKSVIKESMRLHPAAPLLVPRETTETCRINNYTIPAKTRVFINAKAISLDPKYWENPNEFIPERFMESSVDFKGQHFELIPFGVGRRICPGMNFAVPLIELALANLLLRFDWRLPEMEEMNMEEATGITVHKKVPLCLVAAIAEL